MGPPDPGVTDDCETWCESWVLKLVFLCEQQIVSSTSLPFVLFYFILFFALRFLEKIGGGSFLPFLLNYATNIALAMLDIPSAFSQPHNNLRERLILSLYP